MENGKVTDNRLKKYKNKEIKSKHSTFLEGSFELLLKEDPVVRAKIQTFVDYPSF